MSRSHRNEEADTPKLDIEADTMSDYSDDMSASGSELDHDLVLVDEFDAL